MTGVALCTDGLANDIRHSAQVRSWLQENWMQLPDAYRMAEALRFHRCGSHDDRTAVLVSVQPETSLDGRDAAELADGEARPQAALSVSSQSAG